MSCGEEKLGNSSAELSMWGASNSQSLSDEHNFTDYAKWCVSQQMGVCYGSQLNAVHAPEPVVTSVLDRSKLGGLEDQNPRARVAVIPSPSSTGQSDKGQTNLCDMILQLSGEGSLSAGLDCAQRATQISRTLGCWLCRKDVCPCSVQRASELAMFCNIIP